jgi:hypothetical protein
MNNRIINTLTLLLFSCLVGCAALAPGIFHFSLNSETEKPQWLLKNLASSGSLHFKFSLQQSSNTAALVHFPVKSDQKSNPVMLIKISDTACAGAYSVQVQYRSGNRESRTIYLPDKLPWGESYLLKLDWTSLGTAKLAINNSQSVSFNLWDDLSEISVNALIGTIVADEVIYSVQQ